MNTLEQHTRSNKQASRGITIPTWHAIFNTSVWPSHYTERQCLVANDHVPHQVVQNSRDALSSHHFSWPFAIHGKFRAHLFVPLSIMTKALAH